MRFWLWCVASITACLAVACPSPWASASLAVFVFGLVWSDATRASVKRKKIRADEELTEQVNRYGTETRRYCEEVEHLRALVEERNEAPNARASEAASPDPVVIG